MKVKIDEIIKKIDDTSLETQVDPLVNLLRDRQINVNTQTNTNEHNKLGKNGNKEEKKEKGVD